MRRPAAIVSVFALGVIAIALLGCCTSPTTTPVTTMPADADDVVYLESFEQIVKLRGDHSDLLGPMPPRSSDSGAAVWSTLDDLWESVHGMPPPPNTWVAKAATAYQNALVSWIRLVRTSDDADPTSPDVIAAWKTADLNEEGAWDYLCLEVECAARR